MNCRYLPRGLDARAFGDNPGGFVTSDTAVLSAGESEMADYGDMP
jgi:hypothetical protein